MHRFSVNIIPLHTEDLSSHHRGFWTGRGGQPYCLLPTDVDFTDASKSMFVCHHQSITAKDIRARKEFRMLDTLSFQIISTNTKPCGKGGVSVLCFWVCMSVLSLLFPWCSLLFPGAQRSSMSESDNWHLLDSSDEKQKLLAKPCNPSFLTSHYTWKPLFPQLPALWKLEYMMQGSPSWDPQLPASHSWHLIPPWDKRRSLFFSSSASNAGSKSIHQPSHAKDHHALPEYGSSKPCLWWQGTSTFWWTFRVQTNREGSLRRRCLFSLWDPCFPGGPARVFEPIFTS